MNDVQDTFDAFLVKYVELDRYAYELAEALDGQDYTKESGALRFLVDDALQLLVDQVVQILNDDDDSDDYDTEDAE